MELDLKSRVAALNASDTIQAFNGMRVECNDLYLDDIVLSGGAVHRSYQLIPGAAIGAALGAQDGGDGVALGERWYYHYDDLGSVVATTDAAGAQIGVYVPDHWGNYRLVIGTRPDTMGLTGKFFDTDAGLYYFNARWYDPERGHWMSEDVKYSQINHYLFAEASPMNLIDPDGHLIIPPPMNPSIARELTDCKLPIPEAPNPYTDGGRDSNRWAGWTMCNAGIPCTIAGAIGVIHEIIQMPLNWITQLTLGTKANTGFKILDIYEIIKACEECSRKRLELWRKKCRHFTPDPAFGTCRRLSA